MSPVCVSVRERRQCAHSRPKRPWPRRTSATVRDTSVRRGGYCASVDACESVETSIMWSSGDGAARVDHVVLGAGAANHARRGVASRIFQSVFLPEGYPHTVSEDYLAFQIWDTVQAICSYLRGMLCTQAFLLGVGVGDQDASAASAAIQWVMKDGLGMLGGMFFAWSHASRFGYDIKKWRLFADVINDVGLTLHLVSPLFPRSFLLLASLGSICTSMCGVAAGSTRAALSQHFARTNNLADISAKEGIQETFVTLVGLILGMTTAHWLENSVGATWTVFAVLTAIHVAANWRAMSVLVLTSLNRQRADILCRHSVALKHTKRIGAAGSALSPLRVAQIEKVWWWDDDAPMGIRMGCRFGELSRSSPGNVKLAVELHECLGFSYVIVPMRSGINVCLHDTADNRDELQAFWHAHIMRRNLADIGSWKENDTENIHKVMRQSADYVHSAFPAFWRDLCDSGWNVEHMALDLVSDWTFEAVSNGKDVPQQHKKTQ